MSNNNPPWQASSGSSPPLREDQVAQAVRFIADSRTRTSSHAEKEKFLRDKGLTDPEIGAAFSRANPKMTDSIQSPGDYGTPTRAMYIPPPVVEEPIIWTALKSIFSAVGAVAIGVVGYHLYLEYYSNNERNKDSKTAPVADEGRPNYFGSSNVTPGVSEEEFKSAIRELTTAQELRHKETLLAIREISTSGPIGKRKPGGSIFQANDPDTPAGEPVDESVVGELVAEKNGIEAVVRLEAAELETECKAAIEAGISQTLKLVLPSPESFRKLNKSNPRFRKLEKSKLLSHCGYVDKDEFFELNSDDIEGSKTRAKEVLEIIVRLESQSKEDVTTVIPVDGTDSNGIEKKVLPPWMTDA